MARGGSPPPQGNPPYFQVSCIVVATSHGHTVTSVVRATRQVNGRRQTYPLLPHPHPLTDSHEILHTWLRSPYFPTCDIWPRSPRGYFSPYSQSYHLIFIARQHTDARYWYGKSVRLSVCLCVRLSVHNVPVSDKNGLTYRHSFPTIR